MDKDWGSVENPAEGICVDCGRMTPMYWVPDNWWKRIVPPAMREMHICFGDLLKRWSRANTH